MGRVVEMTREDFEDAVRDALDLIPPDLAARIDNVVVLVEDDAPADDPELLGLYEGVALTERDGWWAAGSLPDRITIFRNPTLAFCETVEEVVEEVAVTVVHEIAHRFGIDDERLHELGWD
jgi:predicted Zn-dependent protease with MMP-like domain